MDNVPSLIFDYQIIRRPKKKSKNIFEYAACLNIMYKGNLYLHIGDICIVDFIHQLSLYKVSMKNFIFRPIDSTDNVLCFTKIDNGVQITSNWTNNIITIGMNELICSINYLRYNFENTQKIKIEYYYE